jgi:hypothetical protein
MGEQCDVIVLDNRNSRECKAHMEKHRSAVSTPMREGAWSPGMRAFLHAT